MATDQFLFCEREPDSLLGMQAPVRTTAGWLAVGGRASAIVRLGPLAVAFVGRLHYVDDLIAELGLPSNLTAGHAEADARIVAAAWARWSAHALDRLLGTFAGVVVDERHQHVSIFRDITAGRPVFLATREGEHVAGSDLETIARWRGRQPKPSGLFIASYLQNQWLDARSTPYDGVEALEPGHVAVPSVAGWRADRKADWHPVKVGHLRPEEYVDLVAAALDGAVAERLRGVTKAAVALSGGLDSTNVLAAGVRVAPAIDWTAYCIPFREARGDERERQTAVAQHLGVPQTWVDVAGKGPMGSHDPAGIVPPPWAGNWFFMRSIAQQAAKDGCEVVLDGEDADSLFTGSVVYLTDLVARGQFPTWLRQVRILANTGIVGRRLAVRSSVLLNLPPVLRRRLVDRSPLVALAPLVAPALAARCDLGARLDRHFATSWGPGRQFASGQRLGCTPVHLRVVMEESARAFAGLDVQDAHPFADRKVIELALGLPWNAISPHRPNKHLLDQLALSRLPASHAGQFVKARLDEYYELAVHGFEQPLVVEGLLAAGSMPELFEPGALQSLQRRFEQGSQGWSATRVATLAAWLKSF